MRAARATAIGLLALAAAARGDERWIVVRAPGAERVGALWGDGGDLFAVGERAYHSRDGGASWPARGAALPADAGTRAWASAAWGRGARDVYAVGAAGHVWHSGDGETWARVPAPTGAALLAVAGNDRLVLVAGEGGVVLASRDGARFTAEASGTRAALRALWVFPDGRALAAGEDGVLAARGADGKWSARTLARGDVLARFALDGDGALLLLATDGKLFRSADGGAHFAPLPSLPLDLRGHCDELAAAGRHRYARCWRVAAGHSPLAMEPAMAPFLLHSADGAGWSEEPLPDGAGGLWSRPGGPVYAYGAAIWRLARP